MNLQLCTSRQLLRCISNSVELIILPVKPKFLINLILCIFKWHSQCGRNMKVILTKKAFQAC